MNDQETANNLATALRNLGAVDVNITSDTLSLTIDGIAYRIEGSGTYGDEGHLLISAF
jgi:hypothetical protein